MALKTYTCPNCDSEMCSGIKFWQEGKQSDSFHAYKCHDCGQLSEAGTRRELPIDYEPPRKQVKGQGQASLFGGIESIRSIVNPVPKLVESPAGLSVAVYKIPADAPIGYRTEAKRMMLELNNRSTGRTMPHWYKYRKIKRGKKA